MTRFGWLVVSSVVIAVLGIALLLWGFSRQSGENVEDTDNRTPVVNPEDLSIYTNGVYGFSFFYPSSSTVDDSFTGEASFPWRSGTTATGTPVVRIAFAEGEMRVGAGAQQSCERAEPSERMLGPLTVGTTTWQVFASEQLGTENERRVTSYRTVHGEQCFALETFTPLDGAEATNEQLAFIVHNFSFAR